MDSDKDAAGIQIRWEFRSHIQDEATPGSCLSHVRLRSAAQFLQFIKTRSAPPDVRQYGGDLTILRLLREFQQDFASGTIDALRIGEAFMHNPFKRIHEFLFRIHSARPVEHGIQAQLPCYLQQNPTIPDWCRRKSFASRPHAMERKKCAAGETQSGFDAIYRYRDVGFSFHSLTVLWKNRVEKSAVARFAGPEQHGRW